MVVWTGETFVMEDALAEWQYEINLASGQSDCIVYAVGAPVRSAEHPRLWQCPIEAREDGDVFESGILGRDGLSALLTTLDLIAGRAQKLPKESLAAVSIAFSALDPPASVRDTKLDPNKPIVRWQYKINSKVQTRSVFSLALVGPYLPPDGRGTYAYLFRVENRDLKHEQEATSSNSLFALLSVLQIAHDYANDMKGEFGDEISYLGVPRLWPQDVDLDKAIFTDFRFQ
jgi:hypothetical protein